MNLSKSTRRISLIVLCVASLLLAGPVSAQETFAFFWQLAENQLDIKQGGRVNTIAVHPADASRMFVASETGGLFQSSDGGLHWTHVDSLPVIFTQSVVYAPWDAETLFVSAKADFKKTNGGGVWRSVDGGMSWEQLNLPANTGIRLSAYEISIQPGSETIFVGTSNGFYTSGDRGQNWVRWVLFGDGDNTIFSVLATHNRIYFGGPYGVRVATGNPWAGGFIAPGGVGPGAIRDLHAFGQWAGTSFAFAMNAAGQLYVTHDSGGGWSTIPAAPQGGNCGGISFIKAVARRESLFLYLSERCALYVHDVPIVQEMSFAGTWQLADVDHNAPRDLAFSGDLPVLLGTTGGLHRHENGGNVFRFTGGGREGGYNALQISEVKGQFVGNDPADLYVGAQDNPIRESSTSGDILGSYGANGHYIEMEQRIEPLADSPLTFVSIQQRKRSGRHLANPNPWLDAPGHQGAPAFVRRCQYVQNVRRTAVFRAGLALTEDCGDAWQQFARFTEEPRDLPRVGSPGDEESGLPALLYQPYKSNQPGGEWGRASHLMRIERPAGSTGPGTVRFPAMNPFGGLGVNPTMFAWYQVYGVDPGNPMHIIAPDVVDGIMRETRDGGETWTEMLVLTGQVTGDFNTLLFRTDLHGPELGRVFPVVTAVSFSPQDPRLVLAGTSEGGIFASYNNGGTWWKIPGSERATYVTSFYWHDANTVFVSTYGRGLWKLRNRRIAVPPIFDELCKTCDVVSNDSGKRPPFDASAIVLEGHILAVRTDNRKLREVFVTPGSSVIFTGDLKDAQEDIAVTESDGRDTSQFERLPKGPDGWIATGVVFTSGDELTGAAFAKSEIRLLRPVFQDVKGSTVSPTEGRPYIRLSSGNFNGVATVVPRETFELEATDFAAGASYEVLVDGVAAKGTVTADGSGAFQTTVSAPSEQGYHRVDVRLAGDGQPIDGSVFVVRPEN